MSNTIRTSKYGIMAMIEALDRYIEFTKDFRDDNVTCIKQAVEKGEFSSVAIMSSEVVLQEAGLVTSQRFVDSLKAINLATMTYSDRRDFQLNSHVRDALASGLSNFIDIASDNFVSDQNGLTYDRIKKNLEILMTANHIMGLLGEQV